jgi:hypothetical protein
MDTDTTLDAIPKSGHGAGNWKKTALAFAACAFFAFLLGKACHGGHTDVKPFAEASAYAPPSAQWLLRERMAEDMLQAIRGAEHSQRLKSIGLTGYN